MHRIRDVERTVTAIGECDTVSSARITSISLGTGLAAAQLELPGAVLRYALRAVRLHHPRRW